MQRYAFSNDGDRVEACEATPHLDYLCPECQGPVRLRRGEERAAHFFHRSEGTSCHLRLKSGVHEAVEAWLVTALGDSVCTPECHFKEISRVADVAYSPQRVVFEVQVSPMSPEEARRRTLDYWSIGWHVIWLLHAATYGKARASLFEKALAPIPHYFTDIGYRGGKIWDEMSAIRGEKRWWYQLPPERRTIDPISIDILRPPPQSFPAIGFPATAALCMQGRRSLWSCHFMDDFLSTKVVASKGRTPPWDWPSLWKRLVVSCHLLWLRCLR